MAMFVVNDLLDAILLGAFFFGLIFSAIALIFGTIDIGGDLFGGHGGHDGPAGHGHDSVTPLNLSSILAFLTWFGGVAYLARNGLEWHAAFALGFGVMAGLLGGYLFYRVIGALRSTAGTLSLDEGKVEGTVARVTAAIRGGGTGEVTYKIGDRWQIAPAKTTDGAAVPRGAEVVIVGRAGGFALVESWESFLGDRHADALPSLRSQSLQPPEQRAR